MIFVWQKCGIFCLEGMNLIEFGRMAKKYGYLILSSNIRKKDKKMVHPAGTFDSNFLRSKNTKFALFKFKNIQFGSSRPKNPMPLKR